MNVHWLEILYKLMASSALSRSNIMLVLYKVPTKVMSSGANQLS